MDKRPLAVISVFFILGIVLARFFPDSIKFPHIFIITLIFILSSFIFSKRQKISNILLFLSIIFFAVLLYQNSTIFPKNHISHFLGEEKLKTGIVGIVKSPALTRKPYYGKINSTYIFELEAIKDNGQWWKVQGLSQIRIQTEKDYGYGDRLVVRGTVKRPISRRLKPAATDNGDVSATNDDKVAATFTPYQIFEVVKFGTGFRLRKSDFNYREYLERQNIFALINTRENNVTLLSHNYKSNPLLRYIYSVRAKLKNQILEKMPLESGAFLSAILLGDRSELPKHLQTAFKNCGVYHILPVQNTKKLNYSLKSDLTLYKSIS